MGPQGEEGPHADVLDRLVDPSSQAQEGASLIIKRFMRALDPCAIVIASLVATAAVSSRADEAGPAIDIGDSDFGGVVTGAAGPEAGVWVIAETTDLATKFAKVVVTDERGRYVVPDLPKASYSLWVRGYGLVDLPKFKARPASREPDGGPSAERGRCRGILSRRLLVLLLKIPAASEFPGTGDKGNGIGTLIKTQHSWIDTLKNSCQSCHALGSKGVRTLSKELGQFSNSTDAWARRLQSGQAMTNMFRTLSRLGPDKALSFFADWTDRIAAGELPFAKPERPQGIERNVVISMWDWGSRNTISMTRSPAISAIPPSTPMARSTGRPKRAPISCRYWIRSRNEASAILIPIAIPRRHHRRTCRSGLPRIGGTRRSGTGTPASTIRSWTKGAGVVHREDPTGREPGFLPDGLKPSIGEGRTD